ncbi:MAG: Na/Pi cotransporter family protein/phosphate:sodium symporter [Treponematales bacterium]
MTAVGILVRIAGGLCLFLYGMKVMSDGIQQAAGDRMQRALGFMTRNRFVAVLTGFVVTAVIQSSSATSVMVVSFVNAGLLSLKAAIGVIMGANIGTTLTGWIVSLIGFKFDISVLALPALAAGFVMKAVKWKHRELGNALFGFGLLFLGLDIMTGALPTVRPESVAFVSKFSRMGFLSVLLGVGIGTVVTVIMNSSSATTALVITMAFAGLLDFQMSAAMILGANIGTTTDAPMAAIGASAAAKRTALFHVLFNVAGAVVVLIFFKPFTALVDWLTPGSADGHGITAHLAMFHTMFNIVSTLIFLPLVTPCVKLMAWLIKEKPGDKKERGTYRFQYTPQLYKVPEMAVLQAEKEIRDMAGLVSGMYASFSKTLAAMKEAPLSEDGAAAFTAAAQDGERYADEMREELTGFLIECAAHHLNSKTEHNVSLFLRIIADLENMTDDCYSMSLLIERSVKKDQIFKRREMEALTPYVGLVEEFLTFLREHLGGRLTDKETKWAEALEDRINESRNKLRKLGRKRIEAGRDVKTEMLFIDLVHRIEILGDYCFSITESLAHIR